MAIRVPVTAALQAKMTAVFCLLLASCSAGSSFNAAIKLAGQVENEQGTPLEQVRLHVRKSRMSLLSESFLSSDESSEELANGQFRVSCRSCSGMELFFSKDGYYSETLNFHVGKAEQPGSRMTPEVATDLVRTDLHVTLRSSQNMARLTSYKGQLSTGLAGPVTVLPLRRGMGLHVKPERLDEPLGKDVRNLPGFVSIVAGVTDEGTFAVNVPGARVLVPKSPVLDLNDADGGLILYRFAEGAPGEIYRTMRVAPEEGYQASIVLETENRTGGNYYFYCRIGNLYGKGLVTVPWFDHADGGQQVVQAGIAIRLNLDGSRNVETAF